MLMSSEFRLAEGDLPSERALEKGHGAIAVSPPRDLGMSSPSLDYKQGPSQFIHLSGHPRPRHKGVPECSM